MTAPALLCGRRKAGVGNQTIQFEKNKVYWAIDNDQSDALALS